jgi:hypothetical protein
MQTAPHAMSTARYSTSEAPTPGDRISDREGRLGTVTEVRTSHKELCYGALAIKWDEGVVAIYHSCVADFALISRGPQQD